VGSVETPTGILPMYHQADQHQIHKGRTGTTGQGPPIQHTASKQNQLVQTSHRNGTSYKTLKHSSD